MRVKKTANEILVEVKEEEKIPFCSFLSDSIFGIKFAFQA